MINYPVEDLELALHERWRTREHLITAPGWAELAAGQSKDPLEGLAGRCEEVRDATRHLPCAHREIVQDSLQSEMVRFSLGLRPNL